MESLAKDFVLPTKPVCALTCVRLLLLVKQANAPLVSMEMDVITQTLAVTVPTSARTTGVTTLLDANLLPRTALIPM